MRDAGSAIAQAAAELAAAASQGRDWVRETAPAAKRLAGERASLIDFTRRAQNEALKLARAAGQRMCIGVFGPSQAGKSFLVSRLCMPAEGGAGAAMMADFGDQALDFLAEINPPGRGKESTALVTRFSNGRIATPAGFPVALRLLSETDLVRIFANSYLSDFDVNNLDFQTSEGDPEPVRKLLDELRARSSGAPAAHLDELAIEDLRHYFEANFKSRFPGLRELGYWEFAQDHLPRLALADRARFYGVLWGDLAEFTQIFRLLAGWLERIGCAADAFATIGALVPRERSIIDVDRVTRDLGTGADEADLIPVLAKSAGKPLQERVPRAVLCALTAELRIVLKNRSRALFEQVDLLDFPGARSRQKCRSISDPGQGSEALPRRACELFLRGKVAVLFQRYAEERELTSMLLCMPNGQSEVRDLANLIREWVALTHGATAQERRNQRNALFFVLTMADEQFKAQAGDDEAKRWQRRISSSMLELYQRDGWLDDWDGAPFRNSLLLRNPGVQQAHLIEYARGDGDEAGVSAETGYAATIQPHLSRQREYFLTDEKVTRYFADPAKAFASLLALNDGGVSYLVERLSEVCDQRTKAEQVRARLLATAESFRRRFGAFYDAGAGGSREEKRKQTLAVVERFGRAMAAGRGFGLLLRGLAARESELRELYLTAIHAREEEGTAAPGSAEPAGSIFDAIEAPSEAPAAAGRDRAQRFAEAAAQAWVAALRQAASEPSTAIRRALGEEGAHLLAQELITALYRRGTTNDIAAAIRAEAAVTAGDWENAAELAAAIAAIRINALLTDLGYGGLTAAARPQVPPAPAQPRRRAFQSPQAFEGLPQLGSEPKPPAADFMLDWLAAFVQLSQDNLGFSGAREISEEQNAKLGRILELARIQPRLGAA